MYLKLMSSHYSIHHQISWPQKWWYLPACQLAGLVVWKIKIDVRQILICIQRAVSAVDRYSFVFMYMMA